MNGDGANAKGARRAHDAAGDLAAIGDEESFQSSLHPEHAEARPFRDWRIQCCGESEAQHIARLDGIDDAIIP